MMSRFIFLQIYAYSDRVGYVKQSPENVFMWAFFSIWVTLAKDKLSNYQFRKKNIHTPFRWNGSEKICYIDRNNSNTYGLRMSATCMRWTNFMLFYSQYDVCMWWIGVKSRQRKNEIKNLKKKTFSVGNNVKKL